MIGMRAPLTGTRCSDGRWKIVLTLTGADGHKHKKPLYAKTQREVQELARAYLHEHGRVAIVQRTLSELFDHCEQGPWRNHAPRTKEQYAWARKRIETKFGKLKAAEITTPQIYQWVLAMANDPRQRTYVRAEAEPRGTAMRASEMKTETGGGGSVRTTLVLDAQTDQHWPTEDGIRRLIEFAEQELETRDFHGWEELEHAVKAVKDALTASTETLGKNQTEEPQAQLESAGRERKQGGER